MPEGLIVPDMSSTSRHGYAVFYGETMIAWILTLHTAKRLFDNCKIVNVQNGSIIQEQK